MTKRAFTLIELLIVVAIIAILAAIAVPNFLEAQTRSKVSRVKSDHRTFANAIESYRVDFTAYPIWAQVNGSGFSPILTTPVAYMASMSSFEDPFEKVAGYYYVFFCFADMVNQGWVKPYNGWYGNKPGANYSSLWGILSLGPDRLWTWGDVTYDPSNGTISYGDIARWGP